MSDTSDFDQRQRTARQRLVSMQRLESLHYLREQAKAGHRIAMLESIEKLIELERKSLARDLDGEPA